MPPKKRKAPASKPAAVKKDKEAVAMQDQDEPAAKRETRGRPKRVRIEEPNYKEQDEEASSPVEQDQSEDEQQAVVVPTNKRGRGRPKKAASGDGEGTAAKKPRSSSDDGEQPVKRKGRGRPKKGSANDEAVDGGEAAAMETDSKSEKETTSKSEKEVASKSEKEPASKSEKETASKSEKEPASKPEKEPASKSEKETSSKSEKVPASKSEKEPASKSEKETAATKEPAATKASNTTDFSQLDFSSAAQAPDGRQWNLKLSSWNVNGVRAWLKNKSLQYIKAEDPDIFCVQETKCSEDDLPMKQLDIEGYKSFWSSAEEKGYSGTGVYYKEEPLNITKGISTDKHDKEGRVITLEYEKYYLVVTYVPNAGEKLKRLDYRTQEWDIDFRAYLKDLDSKKPVILCGDLNVAHKEIDLANPKGNTKTAGFTKEEREGFTNLLAENFVDTFRELYPDKKEAYSYWSYRSNARSRNKGWRLDYYVVSKRFMVNVCDSIIRPEVYGSDHCPVVLLAAV